MSEGRNDTGVRTVAALFGSDDDEDTPPPVAALPDDDSNEYLDSDTGKLVNMPSPCCGCRACDHRFSLEIDDETGMVYREARFCKLSYSFISAWCMMLLFATVASGGIIAIGFLDPELVQYQIVGIVLTIVFGSLLPVFLVFWFCLQRRAQVIRKQYRAEKNRGLVFEEEEISPTEKDDKENKTKESDDDTDDGDDDDDDSDDDTDSSDDDDSDAEALARPAQYKPPPGPPASSQLDLKNPV